MYLSNRSPLLIDTSTLKRSVKDATWMHNSNSPAQKHVGARRCISFARSDILVLPKWAPAPIWREFVGKKLIISQSHFKRF
mmetsp:Transcript_18642/g.36538  ORF Transcript_18642/g.36538 Transcript_18642/m.36538 type:complete len:81 (-) Transcript_18642:193-435(-)